MEEFQISYLWNLGYPLSAAGLRGPSTRHCRESNPVSPHSLFALTLSNVSVFHFNRLVRICRVEHPWWREQDLNLRPSAYEADELPTAPSRIKRRVTTLAFYLLTLAKRTHSECLRHGDDTRS